MLHFKWAQGFGSVLLAVFFLTISSRGAVFNVQQTTSPSSPAAGSNIVFFTEIVPQITGSMTITSAFPSSVTILFATNNNGSYTINSNSVTFTSFATLAGQTNLLSIVANTSVPGSLSNVVTVFGPGTGLETTTFVTTINGAGGASADLGDRKSTRLNSSHVS